MIHPQLNEAIRGLSEATYSTPQWELKNYLRLVDSSAPRHGLSNDNLVLLIRFLCESTLISSSRKSSMIKRCLIPNGYLNSKVIYEIAKHLGNNNNNKTAQEIQIGLCKWLTHVFFLLPNGRVHTENYLSIWYHLWQYNYLQNWMTYLIVWYTSSRKDIKGWMVNILTKIGLKSSYIDSNLYATLILKKYLTILGQSKRISDLLLTINIPNEDNTTSHKRKLKSIQTLKLNESYMNTLKEVLIRESPDTFSFSIIDSKVNILLKQLQDSDFSSSKLMFNDDEPVNDASLYKIETLNQLQKNWKYLRLPINVEPLFLSENSTPVIQLFPLSTLHNTNGNRENEEFWNSMYSWININLKRCFMDRQLNPQEKMTLFNIILKNCQIYDNMIVKVVNDFLNLDNLLADEDLFATLTTTLLPIMKPPLGDLSYFRNRLLKILAVCHLTKNERTKNEKNKNVFNTVCSSLITMVRTWLKAYHNRDNVISFGLKILTDVRRLLVGSLNHSIENRHTIISILNLLETLSIFIANFKESAIRKREYLDTIVLKNSSIDKFIMYDDPILLDSCCKYLIDIKTILIDEPTTDLNVQLHNHFILNLTNYLWRNKVTTSKYIFNIPTEFVRLLLENAYFPNVSSKAEAVFTVTGIPSLSYASLIALEKIEKTYSTETHYRGIIDATSFKSFRNHTQYNNLKWIPETVSYEELRILIIREIYKIYPYENIIQFLFTYLKSLTKYQND